MANRQIGCVTHTLHLPLTLKCVCLCVYVIRLQSGSAWPQERTGVKMGWLYDPFCQKVFRDKFWPHWTQVQVHVQSLHGQHYVSKLDAKGKRQKKRQKKKNVEDYIMERLLLSSSESIQTNSLYGNPAGQHVSLFSSKKHDQTPKMNRNSRSECQVVNRYPITIQTQQAHFNSRRWVTANRPCTPRLLPLRCIWWGFGCLPRASRAGAWRPFRTHTWWGVAALWTDVSFMIRQRWPESEKVLR